MMEPNRGVPTWWMFCYYPILALGNQEGEGTLDGTKQQSVDLLVGFGDLPYQVSPTYRMGKAGKKLEPEGKRLQSAKRSFSFRGSEPSVPPNPWETTQS